MSSTKWGCRVAEATFILLLLCLVATVPARGQSVSDRHPDAVHLAWFSTLPFRETPFADLVGLHPMTAEAARERNHYRFEYDAEGRPVRVSFRLGERIRDLNTTANYYFEAPRIDIDYADGRETRHYFDRHGNRIAVNGSVFEAVFSLDSRGYRQSLRFRAIDGAPTETHWGVGLYEWTIAPDGTVHEHREGLDGQPAPLRRGFPFHDIRLHYGPGGYLALMENYGDGDCLTLNELNAAQDRLEFAANGDMRAWNVLDETGARAVGNGPGVARGQIGYDANGLQISQHHQDAAGRPMVSDYGWGVTRSEHDRFGNVIRRGNFALDGATPLDNPRNGYSYYTYQWSENGLHQTGLALFHADGRPALHPRGGFAERRRDHDAYGRLIEERFFDPDGLPTDRSDSGAHRIEHAYDARGRRVVTRLFDAAGSPVAHRSDGWHARHFTYHGLSGVVDRVTDEGVDMEGRQP